MKRTLRTFLKITFLFLLIQLLFLVSTVTASPAFDTSEAFDGKLVISMRYESGEETLPNGKSYYTDQIMPVYLKVDTNELTEDLTNVNFEIRVPKEYLQTGNCKISDFESKQPHTISGPVTEGDELVFKIHFPLFDKTESFMVPLVFDFLDRVVPNDYTLPVSTKLIETPESGDPIVTESNQLDLHPLYLDPFLTKYVNTNQIPGMDQDNLAND